MSVLVAVPDRPEGRAALAAAIAEAETLELDLVVLNLALTKIDPATIDTDRKVVVLERHGRDDRDPVDAVLADIGEQGATRLVIGLKRRTPVGKALLGSVSQRLLLESPVPVLAVKVGEEQS